MKSSSRFTAAFGIIHFLETGSEKCSFIMYFVISTVKVVIGCDLNAYIQEQYMSLQLKFVQRRD